MAVLLPSEYDIKYFDPKDSRNTSGLSHNAGYSQYRKWMRIDNAFVSHADSGGEYFYDMMKMYKVQGFMDGKTILDIGCAKGWMVEALRDMGIQAWGVDCSAYAIGEARTDIKQYLTVADARTYLPTLARNAYNVIYSRWFLSCMSDTDLITLIPEMNRVGFLQIHHIWTDFLPEYYNCHPIEWWMTAGFKRGTRLIVKDNIATPYTVK